MKPLYLTTGEPAGIGPDITLMLAAQGVFYQNVRPVIVLADIQLLKQRSQMLNLSVDIIEVYSAYADDLKPLSQSNQMLVQHIGCNAPVVAGQLNTNNAPYVLKQLHIAASACLNHLSVGIVTAPVQKSIINDAGIAFSGHTEYFQEMASVPRVVMMLATKSLRVALSTTHLPLRAVPDAITRPLLHEVLDILIHDLKTKFGIAHPKILVCGLNPHAGEHGHLGREEIDVIEPVLATYREQHIDVGHCLPADTLFTPHHLKNADAVLAMYHDQGLPVLKSVGFGEAINITLGLPFIRTSVDHGTALSLAGTGKASPNSLLVALQMANQLANSVLMD